MPILAPSLSILESLVRIDLIPDYSSIFGAIGYLVKAEAFLAGMKILLKAPVSVSYYYENSTYKL